MRTKFAPMLAELYVLHPADVEVKDGVVYLPLFMADKTISQRDTKYAKNTSFQGGLTDVLIALKNNIFRNLNVATIGEVISTNESDNTVQVKLLPQASGEISKNITCNSLSFPIVKMQNDAETIEWRSYASVLAMHDLVLVLYTNRNSSQTISININEHTICVYGRV